MARLAGVDLPRNKRIEIALTYIFGIGPKTSQKILADLKIDPSIKAGDLPDGDVNRIREYLEEKVPVEGDLRRQVSLSIKRLMDLNTYRGSRHKRGLPSRGQRTHTNARTRKGPRRLAIAMVKKVV
ncbi:MAG: 30S ribosomal protein S13 [Deltaproteobacteria bacterium CG11_big_fil_rev_8_21_14_0_20_45_16]|nr:MAG: 30S ribosomal protein S13 [Deltaproteobacteria bacterium CG11_big_fil_rev_8_21_14_0_20_45_16]